MNYQKRNRGRGRGGNGCSASRNRGNGRSMKRVRNSGCDTSDELKDEIIADRLSPIYSEKKNGNGKRNLSLKRLANEMIDYLNTMRSRFFEKDKKNSQRSATKNVDNNNEVFSAIAREYLVFQACIDSEICTSCGVCIEACGTQAITLDKNNIVLDSAKCTGCGACKSICPNQAISLIEIKVKNAVS